MHKDSAIGPSNISLVSIVQLDPLIAILQLTGVGDPICPNTALVVKV